MATPQIKSTYSMDVETARTLENLALRWRVSKSEALRRAIRAAAGGTADSGSDALLALDELQGALRLSASSAKKWANAARDERRASSGRQGPRS